MACAKGSSPGPGAKQHKGLFGSGQAASGSECSFSGLGDAGPRQHDDSLTNSLHSEFTHEDLVCDELLVDDEPQLRPQAPSAAGPSRSFSRLAELSPGSCCSTEVSDMIRNELRREQEIRPAGSYLERHSVPGHGISSGARAVAVSWIVEVACFLKLQQETIFLSVSYLDRFLSLSQPVPRAMLQLVAVACLSLAAKQEEVNQLSAAEWADISDNCFTREDLVRMEWLVIDSLGWRGRSPTHYSFLHLFCYGLANCSSITICMASYLAELSLLDYTMLDFSYSTIAASALALAHATTGSTLDMHALLQLAPQLDSAAVQTCFVRLTSLQQRAARCSADLQGLGPVRAKYSQQEWSGVALAHPPSLQDFC